MKHLILFSIRRKLFNKIMLLMMSVVFFVIGGLFFMDVLVKSLFSKLLQPINIHMPIVMEAYFDAEQENFKLTSADVANIIITENKGSYVVEVDERVNDQHVVQLQAWIMQFHRIHEAEIISREIMNIVDYLTAPSIEIVHLQTPASDQGFILITTIYFFMLGFSSTVANEVVSEKTSNMLEMMLTSISHKEHYASKLLIGWIGVLVQACVWLCIFILWFLVRFVGDQGAGLFQFLYRFNLMTKLHVTFFDFFIALNITNKQVLLISLSIIFLILGILLVQLILLLVSIKIENIEEASSVQAPFYLLMLGLYYGTLLINNVHHMQHGAGRVLSFVPGFSMLLMPLRLLYYTIHPLEIGISLVISLGFLIGFYRFGLAYYKRFITIK